MRNQGDAEGALKTADKVVVGEYYLPHFAHVSMEPPAATAHVADGKAEIWAPVQSPGGTRDDIAKTLGIPAENVTVNVTLLGGGFGRKSKCDFALEAALLSKAIGAPVKVQWTREDDVRHDFYPHRLGRADRGRARQERQGHRLASPQRRADDPVDLRRGRQASGSVRAWHGPGRHAVRHPQHSLRESGGGRAHPDRLVPLGVEHSACVRGADHGRPRSRTQTGRDPKELLLELIGPARIVDIGAGGEGPLGLRRTAVELPDRCRAAAGRGGTGRRQRRVEPAVPKGHGLGIAVHRSFVSYIATIVEVAVDDKGKLTVPRVDTAIDCGTFVNPERIRSQIEGAAIMGLSLAKYGEITFKNGRVMQGNFDDFKVARIDEAPLVTNVYITPSGLDVPPSGVGEPGVPPFAPALCNAIFAATGKRIRSLPIGKQLEST